MAPIDKNKINDLGFNFSITKDYIKQFQNPDHPRLDQTFFSNRYILKMNYKVEFSDGSIQSKRYALDLDEYKENARIIKRIEKFSKFIRNYCNRMEQLTEESED